MFGEPQNASLQRRGSVDSLDYTSSEENEEEHFGHVVDSGQYVCYTVKPLILMSILFSVLPYMTY